jgi:hypothetical protein
MFDCLTRWMNKGPDRFCLTDDSFLSSVFLSTQNTVHVDAELLKTSREGELIQGSSRKSSATAFQEVIVARSRATAHPYASVMWLCRMLLLRKAGLHSWTDAESQTLPCAKC